MLFRSDRKSTRLNSSHTLISYAVFCLKKKTKEQSLQPTREIRRRDPRRQMPLSPTPSPAASKQALPRGDAESAAPLICFFFLNYGAPPEFPPLPPPAPLRT